MRNICIVVFLATLCFSLSCNGDESSKKTIEEATHIINKTTETISLVNITKQKLDEEVNNFEIPSDHYLLNENDAIMDTASDVNVVSATIAKEENITKFHIVTKGECLSVIGKKFGVRWQEIQRINGIKNPNLIFPGQKLQISNGKMKTAIKRNIQKKVPETVKASPLWTDPGADPFRGNLHTGLKALEYDEKTILGFMEKISKKDFLWAYATHSNSPELGRVIEIESGKEYRMERMLCGGGNGSPIKIKGSEPDGVTSNWDDVEKVYAGKLYEFDGKFLFVPLVCGNPTLVTLISQTEKVTVVKKTPTSQKNIVSIPPIMKRE